MWMKLWQVLLFAAGVCLPFAFLPHPLPDGSKGSIGYFALAFGAVFAWLGSVGISHLLTITSRRGRQRRASACTESVARRIETLPHERRL